MSGNCQTLENRIGEIERELELLKRRSATVHSNSGTFPSPLRIVTAEGKLVAEINNGTAGGCLSLFNRQGVCVASVGVDGDETGCLAIRNRDGVLVAYLNVETSGGRLILNNNDQRGGVVLFGGDGGDDSGGGINIIRTSGLGGISLWSSTDGGEIEIEGAGGEILAKLP